MSCNLIYLTGKKKKSIFFFFFKKSWKAKILFPSLVFQDYKLSNCWDDCSTISLVHHGYTLYLNQQLKSLTNMNKKMTIHSPSTIQSALSHRKLNLQLLLCLFFLLVTYVWSENTTVVSAKFNFLLRNTFRRK